MEDEELDEVMERMDIDWSIGENLDEEVIPYSLEYYLGVVAKIQELEHEEEEEEHHHSHPKAKGGKKCCWFHYFIIYHHYNSYYYIYI